MKKAIVIILAAILLVGCSKHEVWYDGNEHKIRALADTRYLIENPDSVAIVTRTDAPGIVGIIRFIPVERLQQGQQ